MCCARSLSEQYEWSVLHGQVNRSVNNQWGRQNRSRQQYRIQCATSTTKLARNLHSPRVTLQMVKLKWKLSCLRSLLWQARNLIGISILLLFFASVRRYNTCPQLKEAHTKTAQDCEGWGGVYKLSCVLLCACVHTYIQHPHSTPPRLSGRKPLFRQRWSLWLQEG